MLGRGSIPISKSYPQLVEEWDDEQYSPDELSHGSTKKVWWKCKTCNHRWNLPPNRRIKHSKGRVSGCPACSNKVVHMDGRNSMRSTHPELAEQFHPTKNHPLTPDTTVAGIRAPLFWKCQVCEHEWSASSSVRVLQNTGCPACLRSEVHSNGHNSLARTHPIIAAQFDVVKNSPDTPEMVLSGSDREYWWNCSDCSETWKASVKDRTRVHYTTCTICSGHRIGEDGRNSMQQTHPEIAKEFHPTKNHPHTPLTLFIGTLEKFWWICQECNHEWQSSGSNRIGRNGAVKRGCPVCSIPSKQVHIDGRNSLTVLFPEAAKEFNLDRNHPVEPKAILPGSSTKYWWKCNDCNHEWKASCSNRFHTLDSLVKRGCPACSQGGFNPAEPAYYYSMEFIGNGETWWWKGGISNDVERRRTDIENSLRKNGMFLDVVIREIVYFESGQNARDMEYELLKIEEIRSTTLESFSGKNELFCIDPVKYAKEMGMIEGAANPEPYLPKK